MRFKDKVALITAVGSGIGRATADIMAKEGAVIIGVDNDERRLAMAMEAMNMSGGRAIGRPANALDQAEVDEVVAWAAKQYGNVDILVNAVGGSTIIDQPGATVDELTFDEWQKLIQFNLNGTFLFCHAVTPVMKRRKQRQDRQPRLDRRPRAERVVQQCVFRGEGRHHRVHAQAGVRTRTVRHQRQRDRAEQDADRAHPAALESAVAGGSGGGDRAHAAASHRRSGGPGEGDLLPRLVGCGLRDRADDRRDGRSVAALIRQQWRPAMAQIHQGRLAIAVLDLRPRANPNFAHSAPSSGSICWSIAC